MQGSEVGLRPPLALTALDAERWNSRVNGALIFANVKNCAIRGNLELERNRIAMTHAHHVHTAFTRSGSLSRPWQGKR